MSSQNLISRLAALVQYSPHGSGGMELESRGQDGLVQGLGQLRQQVSLSEGRTVNRVSNDAMRSAKAHHTTAGPAEVG